MHNHGRSSLAYPTWSAIAGVLLAGAALTLDAALPRGWLFGWAPPAAGAQVLLGSVTGSIITVSAVVFWVRGTFVQLSSGQLSSRVLRWYLADGFQRHTLAFLAGVLGYIVTVALAVGDDGIAPTVATLLAMVLSIGTLLLVVSTVWDSASATQLSEIMAHMAGETIDTVHVLHPEPGSRKDTDPVGGDHDGARPTAVLPAPATGWVQSIDSDRLLSALPAGATLHLHTRVGDFVLERGTIGHLWAAESLDEATVSSAIVVTQRRTRTGNVEFGIRELVDIALQALAPGTRDATSAYEAIQFLGAIMHSVLLRDLPSRIRDDEHGRCLVYSAELDHADYVAISFDQIRQNGAVYPASAAVLLTVLNRLVGEVLRAGLTDRVPPLRRQIAMTLDAVRRADVHEGDRAQVLALAERLEADHAGTVASN